MTQYILRHIEAHGGGKISAHRTFEAAKKAQIKCECAEIWMIKTQKDAHGVKSAREIIKEEKQ